MQTSARRLCADWWGVDGNDVEQSVVWVVGVSRQKFYQHYFGETGRLQFAVFCCTNVIQVGMCETCITDVYFPTLNRTPVFPFVLINSINLLMKMNEFFFFQSEMQSLRAIYYVQTFSSWNRPFSWWLKFTQTMRTSNWLTAVYFT